LQQSFNREMSSPLPFQPSSPESGNGIRRKSQFTYRQLAQLALSSTTCPLRVIAHVDLDAFYAQCEMVRLGVAEDQPLAVQQWYYTTSLMLDRMIANVEDAGRV
jgi:DNA polymerase eta